MNFVDILGIVGFAISFSLFLWEVYKQILKLTIDECRVQFVCSDIPYFGYLFTFTLVNKTAKNLSIISVDLELNDKEKWSCLQSTRDEVKNLFDTYQLPNSAYETALPINLPPYCSESISLLFRSQKTTHGSENLYGQLFTNEYKANDDGFSIKIDIKNSDDNNKKLPEVTFSFHTPWKKISRKVKVVDAEK